MLAAPNNPFVASFPRAGGLPPALEELGASAEPLRLERGRDFDVASVPSLPSGARELVDRVPRVEPFLLVGIGRRRVPLVPLGHGC